MKSAYELAMEKLEASAPTAKLTDSQRAEIAELDQKFKAKIAERETFLQAKIAEARTAGEHGAVEVQELEDQLRREVAGLREDAEMQKEKIRNAG